MLKKIFLFILCVFSISASATTLNGLIQKYGQPVFTAHMRNGNTVYAFSAHAPQYAPPTSNPTVIVAPGGRAIGASVPSYVPTYNSVICSIVVEVDPSGQIVKEDRRGACQGS